MKFFATILFATAGVSAATTVASAPASSASCAADYIVSTCLDTENAKVNACDPTDYSCLCAAYQAVLTCYNNCPNDPRAAPASSQVDSFCRVASQQASTATHPATKSGSASTAAPPSATTTDDSSSGTGASPTGNSTASASAATHTNAAPVALNGNAAGIAVALAGAVVAML